jgi:hypothetical protein
MARITSQPFNLSPGFEAEGAKITQAVVRLLTNNEQETADSAVLAQFLTEVKAAESQYKKTTGAGGMQNQNAPILDEFQKFAINMRIERKFRRINGIDCFITEEGKRIDDRSKIEAYHGLLLELDVENIEAEQEALRNVYRRTEFRVQYQCPHCEGAVDPATATRL